jgi:hypothetical protein
MIDTMLDIIILITIKYIHKTLLCCQIIIYFFIKLDKILLNTNLLIVFDSIFSLIKNLQLIIINNINNRYNIT